LASSRFTLDFSKIFPNMEHASEAVKAQAEIGIGRALLQIRTDMISQRPTAPIKEGFLRGSISIHVMKNEIPVPLGAGEKADKKVKGYSIPLKPGEIRGIIGINVPYAARWHEVPAHFSDPEAGNKYLESKMANNKKLYRQIIINAVNEATGTP